jgi:hypothetical protein
MSVSKANILSFASFLGLDLEDDTTIAEMYDDVVNHWAFLPIPPFQKATLVSLTLGTSIYDFEADMVRELWAVFEDSELLFCSEDSLEAYESTWRDDTGDPEALTSEQLTNQYRVYPIPVANSGAAGAEPYGEDYPDDILFLLYADKRVASIAEIYEIPIALKVLAREFMYDSQHQDLGFSEACSQIGQIFLSLLGY